MAKAPLHRRSDVTLIVAQLKGSVISAVSDTGTTLNRSRLPKREEIAKICVLSPDAAVAFSGDVHYGRQGVAELRKLLKPTFKSLTTHLLKIHQASEGATDFLLLLNKPVAKIVEIADGRIKVQARVAWLGEQEGFDSFQAHRNDPNGGSVGSKYAAPMLGTSRKSEATKNNVTFQLVGAMRYVIQEPKVYSVSGEVVAVNNVDGQFEYRQYSYWLSPKRLSLLVPEEIAQQLRAEIQESANYSISCFVSGSGAKRRGIAYHYLFGKITHLFSENPHDGVLEFENSFSELNIEEFKDATESEFGIWEGTIQLTRLPPNNYGTAPTKWRAIERDPFEV